MGRSSATRRVVHRETSLPAERPHPDGIGTHLSDPHMCGTSAHGRRICAQHPHETAALTRHACPTHPVRCHLTQDRVSSPTRAFGRASTSALPARMTRAPRSEDAVVRPLPEIDTIRRSERMEPLDNRRLRRALDEGTWVKVAPGAFVRSDHWLMLAPLERHRVRVHEVARRLEPAPSSRTRRRQRSTASTCWIPGQRPSM